MLDFERKFIDTIETDEWQIETDSGWSDIKSIGKTIEYDEWVLITQTCELICADNHIVFDENMNEVFVKDLISGDKIQTRNGVEVVCKCYKDIHDRKSNMFDFQLNDENHRFYTGDILSHNSMWLYNTAKNAADSGANVLVVSVEMAKRKVMKRLGAMRLKIDVDQYDELSKDPNFIKSKIAQLKNTTNLGLFNDGKIGKIWVRKFNTGSCTIDDLDNLINKYIEIRNIKLDMVVIDYINLMSVDKLHKEMGNNLFLKGKHLAEGLRYLADKYNVAVITATQTDKAVWGANDIKLADIPESKAVAETADCVWAIIRNNEMRKNNKYRLKILKLRDGDHKGEIIGFDFHPRYLSIENDNLEGTGKL